MVSNEMIRTALLRLQNHIEQENYKGFDPYDALTSPLFRLPLLRSNHFIRFASQQLIKRSPINLRPILGIKKGENPVTLGLALQAYVSMKHSGLMNEDHPITSQLIQRLDETRSGYFKEACWGYDFPWEARYASIPAHYPTIVATGIISNALFQSWQNTGDKKTAEIIISACKFAGNNLQKTKTASGHFFYSYSPLDHECVFNAGMKAVRLFAQGYQISNDSHWSKLAEQALDGILHHQNEDGSWPYSLRNTGHWIDNYHTAYILDCLDEYIKITGDTLPKASLEKGYSFYKEHFISEQGLPSLYHNKLYPVDCTGAAQTLLTLSRFNDIECAVKVAEWTIRHMQKDDGSFMYRLDRGSMKTKSYMRWSNAWMFAGLAALSDKLITQEKKQ